MTVVTTRPNGTSASSGFSATGAGSRHAATNDDSDSSYVRGDGTAADSVLLQFAEPTIPSGGLVKTLALRARTRKVSATPPGILSYTLWPDATVTADNASSAQTVTWGSTTTVTLVPAQTFASAPTGVEVGLRVSGTGAQVDVFELYVDTVYVAKPVTAPSAPTGTVTTTNVPTVTWANTLDIDGNAQTHYQVRVFTAAQYGAGGFNPASSTATFDTGDVASAAASAQVTTPLASATYRAYVRVGQTVNGVTHWSDYAYTGFVVNVDLPAVPTLALTAQSSHGRILVGVTGNSGTATTNALEVERSLDEGATWEPVRVLAAVSAGDGISTGTSVTLHDYEVPNGTLATYRARALHNYSGLWAASAWTSTATAVWSSTSWWLKCPTSPGLNVIVSPSSLPSFQRPARQGIFQPLGRPDTVICADTRGAPRGSLGLDIATVEEQDEITALLDSGATLLLQGPPEHHWPDRYIALGDEDRARWIDKAWIEPVIDTLQWFEVAVPVGDVDAWPS